MNIVFGTEISRIDIPIQTRSLKVETNLAGSFIVGRSKWDEMAILISRLDKSDMANTRQNS